MTSYVLDASVAVKWFLPPSGETLVAEALRILEGYTKGSLSLVVPDLFWPEVGNVLWKAVRLGRMSQVLAEDAIKSLSDLRVATWPSRDFLAQAFSMAASFQCTVYDCTYVAMAAASNRLMITADERLSNTLAAYFPVRWLGSIS